MTTFSLTSPAFKDTGTIPKKYTCTGEDISPELNWEGAPQETYNIPETVHQLAENSPKDPQLKNGSLQGLNHFGNIGLCFKFHTSLKAGHY